MYKLQFMMFDGCPYCAQAEGWLEELKNENPEYATVAIRQIDENLHPELTKGLNYYYVPTFFLLDDEGKVVEKLHEGAATKEKIRAVLDAALKK